MQMRQDTYITPRVQYVFERDHTLNDSWRALAYLDYRYIGQMVGYATKAEAQAAIRTAFPQV